MLLNAVQYSIIFYGPLRVVFIFTSSVGCKMSLPTVVLG